MNWTTGTMSGDVADYYRGGERSNDQGYPYQRERLEAADTARPLEHGRPGSTLAITAGPAHTSKAVHGANVTDGFLDALPAARYSVARTVDPDGVVTVKTTDEAGHVLGERTAPDADAADWRERQTWDGDGSAPDAIGRLWRTERNHGSGRAPMTVAYAYNPAGKPVTYRQRSGDEEEWQVDYHYLGTGELARVKYPHVAGAADQVQTVVYGYDCRGLLATIGSPDAVGEYATYTYDANGKVIGETLAPSAAQPVTRRIRYNSPGWPTALESKPFTERLSYWEQPGYGGARYYGGQVARLDYTFGAVGTVGATDTGDPTQNSTTATAGANYSWLLAFRDNRNHYPFRGNYSRNG